MSAAAELLQELHARGARVRADGDVLRIRPPSVVEDPALLARIKAEKQQLLALLRSMPPELVLAERGRAALGGEASAQPAPEYATPSSAGPGEPRLDQCGIDMHAASVGPFLLVRDEQALEALDRDPAVPVLYFAEVERYARSLGEAGLRALVAAREVFGPAVELKRLTRSATDG